MKNVKNLINNDTVIKHKSKNKFPELKWKKNWKSFNINWFEYSKYRIWLYISKFEKQPLHFCLVLGNIITLDTAHVGKKIFGRLNLIRLFKKDYTVYSNTEEVTQSNY